MANTEIDFMILGQGLAGSILAYKLIENGHSVMVLDNAYRSSSSVVAAGIINPITGHRLNLTDNFEQYLAAASNFYRSLETALSCKVFDSIAQTRLIKNPSQAKYLQQRLSEPTFQSLITRCASAPIIDQGYGAVSVGNTYVVRVNRLLEEIKRHLRAHRSYQQRHLDYDDVVLRQDKVEVGPLQAKQIIFCEGHTAIHNPWLKSLPFKLAKGEVLSLKTEHSLPPGMLNWGNWLLTQNGRTKLGASYDWNTLDIKPTKDVGAKLLKSFTENTQIAAKVTEHLAGVRPTTLHRIPFVGRLKGSDRMLCFNGFGSKGCLTIPYYAELLVNSLQSGKAIPESLSKWL